MIVPTNGSRCLFLSGDFGSHRIAGNTQREMVHTYPYANFTGLPISE